MKIKQTIRNIALGSTLVFSLGFGLMVPTTPVNAITCGGVDTALLECGGDNTSTDLGNTGLWHVLLLVVNILTAGVGILALAGIVYGAVLYSSSGGNPEQVKKARMVFTNVVIGVIAYAGMFVLLNFLVPGGAFVQP